jgi:hypothetical protein
LLSWDQAHLVITLVFNLTFGTDDASEVAIDQPIYEYLAFAI